MTVELVQSPHCVNAGEQGLLVVACDSCEGIRFLTFGEFELGVEADTLIGMPEEPHEIYGA
jgi:hypothetical protein